MAASSPLISMPARAVSSRCCVPRRSMARSRRCTVRRWISWVRSAGSASRKSDRSGTAKPDALIRGEGMGDLRKLELGVFLPIGNNGFLMSKTAPQYRPSFEMNKQIAILAENLGFDYVFSMSKWRGFGGPTHFWDVTLESLTLMTGLAAVTSRIGLIATIQ